VLQGYGERVSVAGRNFQKLMFSRNFLGTASVSVITQTQFAAPALAPGVQVAMSGHS
jgi:hypothetical protein